MKTGEKREILKEGGRKVRGERQIRRNGYIVFAISKDSCLPQRHGNSL